jgi:hypothetical protein
MTGIRTAVITYINAGIHKVRAGHSISGPIVVQSNDLSRQDLELFTKQ